MSKHSNNYSIERVRYLTGFILVVLLAMFFAPQAFAKKPCWDEDHNKIPCEPADAPLPPGPDTHAGLSGEILDSNLRSCKSEANPMEDRGNYNCSSVAKIGVSVANLGEPVASRKNRASLCHTLQQNSSHLELTVDTYIYGWTDSCNDDGECGIEVRIRSSDPIIRQLTLQKSHAIEMTLFAQASGLNANIYSLDETMVLDVYSVEIDFKKSGTTRTAVLCNFDVQGATGYVDLHVEPD